MATQPVSLCGTVQSRLFWQSFSAAQHWQLYSGICNGSGGVARYYRFDRKVFAPVSNEITGYYISSMLGAYETSADRRYLDRARECGRYLVQEAWDEDTGAFPFEPAGPGQAGFTYFFDTGIILRALVSLWQTSNEAAYLHRALDTARAMWTDFVGADKIQPILTLPAKRPVHPTNSWSTNSGCYQLKAALGWHELGHATGDARWRKCYQHVLKKCLDEHYGFIDEDAQSADAMDKLHAYCYFLEGLLPAITEHTEYAADALATLRHGIRLVGQSLRFVSPVLLRSDVVAQLLRIRLYAAALGLQKLDEEHALEEASLISSFQAEHTDPKINGGFYFGREGGLQRPFVNPVSTAFCVQALALWDEYSNGELRPVTSKLI